MTPYTLRHDIDLAPRTTFRAAARTAWLAEVRVSEALPDVLALPQAERVLILGGGSNVLFTRDFPGLVVHLDTRGIAMLEESGDTVKVRVAAGENWDGFVRWSLSMGLAGLENLIFIPGSVGAAPIQNIGAYGVELSEFVHGVDAWDRRLQDQVRLSHAECGFAYRDSVFKRDRERYIVTAVEFRLPRERPLQLEYSGVHDELIRMGVTDPDHIAVAAAVENLRRLKLPDPVQVGNAGSFFKNPVLPEAEVRHLTEKYQGLPVYPAGAGMKKLSAAWLIERCGFKGHRQGDAGISEQHALVLINRGHATGAELWDLAQRVRDTVAKEFGVTLEPEPLIV